MDLFYQNIFFKNLKDIQNFFFPNNSRNPDNVFQAHVVFQAFLKKKLCFKGITSSKDCAGIWLCFG